MNLAESKLPPITRPLSGVVNGVFKGAECGLPRVYSIVWSQFGMLRSAFSVRELFEEFRGN